MTDRYAWWRNALTGKTPPVHESEPHCGYFKVRDRRGLNMKKAAIKRPFVAAAIWRDHTGELRAEIAGTEVPMDRAWPWLAKYPISFEAYQHWHTHEAWPKERAR